MSLFVRFNSITFTPKCYYKIISNDMIQSLKQIYDKWSEGKINISFISLIYGKLSLLGYSGERTIQK